MQLVSQILQEYNAKEGNIVPNLQIVSKLRDLLATLIIEQTRSDNA